MNRRQFLQALASFGASISIPVVLQSASAAQVDEAWAKALEDPWYFEVTTARSSIRAWQCPAFASMCSTFEIGYRGIRST